MTCSTEQTEQPEEAAGADDREAAESTKKYRLRWWRRLAIACWAAAVVTLAVTRTLSFGTSYILLIVGTGIAALSIGRRNVLLVARDWLPFGILLGVYDMTRGLTAFLGMPTRWHLGPDADHALFGVVPTVWLQSHLKHAEPQWWEVITSVVYMSYFVVPFAVAGWLWLKDRTAWRKYVTRFVALFFLGLVGFVMVPAAPPWAAARCSAAEVADGPPFPHCITQPATPAMNGGVIGVVHPRDPQAEPFVERISSRGWDTLHIGPVKKVVEVGEGRSNQVAAIPSLHTGVIVLVALFLWPRVRARWRPLVAAYPLAMAFTLVYAGEHYVIDTLIGASLAALVVIGCGFAERWWERRRGRERSLADVDAEPLEKVAAD
ncbi:phosphatase PAP2 family protein [Jongsikchunia kroppenstedtii]|uniref:phosphatase PAP2 family protein n=1 Tax=Jongsikchunia kroppenstedtii TaxID=1121721 RepID=UPI000375D218|nr:phosphatase PAP2 family protein [Jongsikchunia kroppenstedtii]